jgi:hypothetical protein
VVLKIKAFSIPHRYVKSECLSERTHQNFGGFSLASYPLITVRLERPEGRELLENASRPSEASKKLYERSEFRVALLFLKVQKLPHESSESEIQ